MDYMLLIYQDERSEHATEVAHDECLRVCAGLIGRLAEEGKHLAASPLHSTATATSVRVRNGARLITDGPFAETREQLAGFMLIRTESLDEALDVAAQHPVATDGTVEVRPCTKASFP